MPRADLAVLLHKVADAVASGDSAEGRISWLLGDEPGEVEVEAAIRTGNLDGQGGYHLIEATAEVPT